MWRIEKKTEIQKRDANFKQLKALLIDSSITLNVYLDRIVKLFEFLPRKKYVEELENTDDSDAESDEDDDSDEEDIEEIKEAPIVLMDQPTTSQSRPLIRIGGNFDDAFKTAVEDANGKIACNICGKRYKPRGFIYFSQCSVLRPIFCFICVYIRKMLCIHQLRR